MRYLEAYQNDLLKETRNYANFDNIESYINNIFFQLRNETDSFLIF